MVDSNSAIKAKRALIIKTDRIGDFIIFSSLLKCYRKLYKGYEIHLLIIPEVRPFAEHCPYIDKIITFNIEKPTQRQIKELKTNYYDKAIYPVYSRCKDRDKIIIFINAKEKIAFDGDNSNDIQGLRFRYDKFFTTIIQSDQKPEKEIERNAEFLRKLGLKGEIVLNPRIWFNQKDEQRFQRFKSKYELKNNDYIVLIPGTRYPIRLWSRSKWIDLVERLFDNYEGKIVFCGADKDKNIINDIIKKLEPNDKVINLAGKTDLRLLAKIIGKSNLLISTESAAIHIAVAVKKPNICLMGGGHFRRFYPYGDLGKNRIVFHKMDCFGCNWNCKFQRNDISSKIKRKLPFLKSENKDIGKCIKDIEVDDVIKEVDYLLRQ